MNFNMTEPGIFGVFFYAILSGFERASNAKR